MALSCPSSLALEGCMSNCHNIEATERNVYGQTESQAITVEGDCVCVYVILCHPNAGCCVRHPYAVKDSSSSYNRNVQHSGRPSDMLSQHLCTTALHPDPSIVQAVFIPCPALGCSTHFLSLRETSV